MSFLGTQPTLTHVPPSPHLVPWGDGLTKSNRTTCGIQTGRAQGTQISCCLIPRPHLLVRFLFAMMWRGGKFVLVAGGVVADAAAVSAAAVGATRRICRLAKGCDACSRTADDKRHRNSRAVKLCFPVVRPFGSDPTLLFFPPPTSGSAYNTTELVVARQGQHRPALNI